MDSEPFEHRDLLVGEAAQRHDAAAREERGVHLERRVLGRRADERHGPVLDVRQERVLLGLREAVDLVVGESVTISVLRFLLA